MGIFNEIHLLRLASELPFGQDVLRFERCQYDLTVLFVLSFLVKCYGV